MTAPFIIFALPRSRTAWLSRYLSYGGLFVGHDTAVFCEKPEDFVTNFARGMAGCVETGAIIGWRYIRRMMPNAKFMVITRPTLEIRGSLASKGIVLLNSELEHRRSILENMALEEKCPVYGFHDLNDADTRAEIFQYCTGRPFDSAWDAKMSAINIQINMPERINTLVRDKARIELLKERLAAK